MSLARNRCERAPLHSHLAILSPPLPPVCLCLRAQGGLDKSMGLFLQKTNIIRDYLEDYVDGRAFWPKEVRAQHTALTRHPLSRYPRTH